MKLVDIYKLAVKKGVEKDVRAKTQIKKELDKARSEFRRLKGADKKAFDRDRFTNPYSDTRILYGDHGSEVKTILVGIDIEMPELLLADTLNRQGAQIDLVLAHHPEGIAWAGLYDVMGLQVTMLERLGIPLNVASDSLKDRIEEVQRALAPANHARSVDMARILNIPFMCVHTPADNHVTTYLQQLFNKRKPTKLSGVLSVLKSIPEYADGLKKGAGPKLLIGDPDKKAGKIFVDMTGGTEGPKKIFARLSQAGVDTIVGMHLSEEHFKNAKEEKMNVVIAGHIASDALGLNLFLDELEKMDDFRIMPCSGFIRIRR